MLLCYIPHINLELCSTVSGDRHKAWFHVNDSMKNNRNACLLY